MEELPPWVNTLCFDNCLSIDAVRLLASILMNTTRQTVDQSGTGIQGLAITNNPFREEELRALIEFLSAQRNESIAESSTPAFTPDVSQHAKVHSMSAGTSDSFQASAQQHISEARCRGLCWLDLSGNKLGDVGAAAVAQALTGHTVLEALDLSRNGIKQGVAFVEAVCGVGKLLSFEGGSFALQSLFLAGNQFAEKSVSRLCEWLLDVEEQAITSAVEAAEVSLQQPMWGRLRHLDLSHNALPLSVKSPLVKLLKEGRALAEVNLAHNKLSLEFVKELQFAVHRNPTLFFLRIEGNSAPRAQDIAFIQKQLHQNRCNAAFTEQARSQVADRIELPLYQGVKMSPQLRGSAALWVAKHDKQQLLQKPDAGSAPTPTLFAPSQPNAGSAEYSRPTLCVLHSSPLAWRTRTGELQPMEVLNFDSEREVLWQSLREASRDIHLRFDFATTERLRNVVTLGCRAVHYSGHGSPDCLSFEDGMGGLHVVRTETLQKLCSAGAGAGAKHAGNARLIGCHGVLVGCNHFVLPICVHPLTAFFSSAVRLRFRMFFTPSWRGVHCCRCPACCVFKGGCAFTRQCRSRVHSCRISLAGSRRYRSGAYLLIVG